MLKAWQRERQAFVDDVRAISERVNPTEAEADAIIAEAIQQVRAEARDAG